MSALLRDIDFTVPSDRSTALLVLAEAFNQDPMMQLFDKDARYRLAGYLVLELEKKSQETGNPANMYLAANHVQRYILPFGPYAVFGDRFASHVAGLIQQALYPHAYKARD